MSKTKIEWAQDTWNPLAGCTEISPGCLNCYAATMAHRLAAMGQEKYKGTTKKLPSGKTAWTDKMNLDEEALQIPLKKKKPTMYFVNSMSDLFHEDVPDEFIGRVFHTMGVAHQHTFQVLTKRAERMCAFVNAWVNRPFRDPARMGEPFDNVWLGVSVENKQHGLPRIEHLLKTPAAVRFLSVEPLLEDLGHIEKFLYSKLHQHHSNPAMATKIVDWVIVGGESGHGSRPCNVQWIRNIIKQCKDANVSAFVKQLGGNIIDHDTTSADNFPEEMCWPDGTRTDGHQVILKNKKGGDSDEWPRDLRVREMPATKEAVAR